MVGNGLEARLLMPNSLEILVVSTSLLVESVWPCFQLNFVSITGAVSQIPANSYSTWVGYLV